MTDIFKFWPLGVVSDRKGRRISITEPQLHVYIKWSIDIFRISQPVQKLFTQVHFSLEKSHSGKLCENCLVGANHTYITRRGAQLIELLVV